MAFPQKNSLWSGFSVTAAAAAATTIKVTAAAATPVYKSTTMAGAFSLSVSHQRTTVVCDENDTQSAHDGH